MENMYSQSELENMTGKAEKLQQKYPYSESDVKETWKNLEMEETHQEVVLAKYGKKKSKIKKIRKKSLESGVGSVLKEDLKMVGKTALKVVTYPTFGNFAIPTMIRKAIESDSDGTNLSSATVGFITLNAVSYLTLYIFAPEAIPYVAGIQITTNVASGIYEYIKHVKNRVKGIE